MNITFYKSIFKIDELPATGLPEFVFCGRSNVGKSSLINALFNKKDLAKVSSTPGKTQSINYYNVDNRFYLVDLPGYGYAKISKTEQEKWAKLITAYLSGSKDISVLFHLLDSRHTPSNLDDNFQNFISHHYAKKIIILTKSDKLNQSELSSTQNKIQLHYPQYVESDRIVKFSTIKPVGKKEIFKIIENMLHKS